MKKTPLLSVKGTCIFNKLPTEFYSHILFFNMSYINFCFVANYCFCVFRTCAKVSISISSIACSILSLRWEIYYMGKNITFFLRGTTKKIKINQVRWHRGHATGPSIPTQRCWNLICKYRRTSPCRCGGASCHLKSKFQVSFNIICIGIVGQHLLDISAVYSWLCREVRPNFLCFVHSVKHLNSIRLLLRGYVKDEFSPVLIWSPILWIELSKKKKILILETWKKCINHKNKKRKYFKS